LAFVVGVAIIGCSSPAVDPQAGAAMIRPHAGSCASLPASIKPEGFQVGEDLAEIISPGVANVGDILQQGEPASLSKIPKNTGDCRPLVPMIVLALERTGPAEGLAGEPGDDPIDAVPPSLSCNGADSEGIPVLRVCPDGETFPEVGLALFEDGAGVGVELDGAGAGPSEESPGEERPAAPGI